MSDSIGVNKSGIDKKIILGNEIRNETGNAITSREEALEVASLNKGSELVYKADDDKWHVVEVKEKGILYGVNNLSKDDKADINLDADKMKKAGMSDAVISFVEDDNLTVEPSGIISDDPIKNIRNAVLGIGVAEASGLIIGACIGGVPGAILGAEIAGLAVAGAGAVMGIITLVRLMSIVH